MKAPEYTSLQNRQADSSIITELERVPKKALKKADSCPICNNAFLDGKFFVQNISYSQLLTNPCR